MKRIVLATILFGIASQCPAQEFLGGFFTLLSANDMRNSRGTPLTEIGEVLRQDRANYHHFGMRDKLDEPDAFFASSESRDLIPELYSRGPGAPDYIVRLIRNGTPRYIMVSVFGHDGVPDFIKVFEGAG